MKIRLFFMCLIGIFFLATEGSAYLYSNSVRFQESLDIENGKFYIKGSDYYVWSRNKDYNSTSTIYSYSFKDGSIKEHYKADASVSHIRYLPESNEISFVSKRSIYLVNESGVKTGGFTVDSNEGFIPEYVWNHDRTKVVYLLAKYDPEEGKEGPPYTPLGVWLYDLNTGEKNKIADWGMYLETDVERNYLYFRTAEATYRYEFASGKLEQIIDMKLATLAFLECSNDKQYCALDIGMLGVDGPYESTMAIFDNKRGTIMSPDELDVFKGINATSVVWGKTSRYMAFSGRSEKNSRNTSVYIYDFESSKVIEKMRVRGWVVGVSPDRNAICFYDKNKNKFFLKKFPRE